MLPASRPAAAVALAACLVCGVLVASASVTAAPVPADDATSTTPSIVATTAAISTSSASSTSSNSSGAGAARSLTARPGPLAQAAQALAPLGHLVKEAPDRVKEGLRKGADGLRGRIHSGLSRITGGTQSTNKVQSVETPPTPTPTPGADTGGDGEGKTPSGPAPATHPDADAPTTAGGGPPTTTVAPNFDSRTLIGAPKRTGPCAPNEQRDPKGACREVWSGP